MNTLDLNAYGVQEMNKQEMVETDGGGLGLFFAGLVVGLILAELNDRNAGNDFREGFNAGREFARN